MSGVLGAVAVLVALGIIGAPLACWCAGRRIDDWVRFVFEAGVLGLVVTQIGGLLALRIGGFGRPGLLGLAVVWLGAWVVVLGRGGPPFVRIARPDAVAGAVAAIAAVAVVLRHLPAYFIFMTGDMGEYVNRANVLAAGGGLVDSFPHGFTVFLAMTAELLGRSRTVAGVPALGVLLVLGVAAYARVARLRTVAVLTAALAVALHPVAVWFSLFPVSESLYATLLVAVLVLLATARAERSVRYAVVAGIAAGLLLVVRGNGLLLAPIVVVLALASAAVDEPDRYRVQRFFTVSALLSLAAAYAYDVQWSHRYFVDMQFPLLVPDPVLRLLRSARLVHATPAVALAAAAGTAAVVGVCGLVRRHGAPRLEVHRTWFWRGFYAAVVAVTLATAAVMREAGLLETLGRWQVALLVLAVVGVGALIVRPDRDIDGVSGALLLLVIGTYAVLFARRYPAPRGHAYYLYWDRYLYSEALPAALVLVALAVHVVAGARLRQGAPGLRRAVRIATTGVLVVVVAGVVWPVAETRRATELRFFGEAYAAMAEVDALAAEAGAGPIVYSGAVPTPPGWFFANTFRAFALPLTLTFDRQVIDLPADPFARDPVLDPVAARTLLREAGYRTGALVALRSTGSERPAPAGPGTRYVGTVDYDMPVLNQPKDDRETRFGLVGVHLDVYALA
ncbi:MAG: hypothetical protein ACKO1Y_09460 [Actinomycetota bacterium]